MIIITINVSISYVLVVYLCGGYIHVCSIYRCNRWVFGVISNCSISLSFGAERNGTEWNETEWESW